MTRGQRIVVALLFTAIIFIGCYIGAERVAHESGILGPFRGPFDFEITWWVWVLGAVAAAGIWLHSLRGNGGRRGR